MVCTEGLEAFWIFLSLDPLVDASRDFLAVLGTIISNMVEGEHVDVGDFTLRRTTSQLAFRPVVGEHFSLSLLIRFLNSCSSRAVVACRSTGNLGFTNGGFLVVSSHVVPHVFLPGFRHPSMISYFVGFVKEIITFP